MTNVECVRYSHLFINELKARLSDALVKVGAGNMLASALPVLVNGGMAILPVDAFANDIAILIGH